MDSFIPALILIKILKGFVQVIFSFHAIHVHRSCYELKVINCSISINISLEEQPNICIIDYALMRTLYARTSGILKPNIFYVK